MLRPSLLKLLLAFIAGLVLLWLTLSAIGFIATLPKQSMLEPLRQSQSMIGLTMYSVLVFHLPVALLSGLFSLAIFRLLRARDLWTAVALSTPWVIYCFVAAMNFWNLASNFPPFYTLLLLLRWEKWPARLSVLLGVWAARKASSGTERGEA